jgi:Histidine kinase-, DNA gyrase B-, and HSP90-like ATPase.
MSLKKEQRHEIKQFILLNLRQHPKDIVKVTQEKYNLSRATVNKYMHELAGVKQLSITGSATRREYSLEPIHTFTKTYSLVSQLEEDKVWRQDLQGLFVDLPRNVRDICHYGFTEMFNNAIDHSEGSEIIVDVTIWIDIIDITISDNGIGIFNKIQQKFNLDDPLHAILELSKGKLTTDPSNHTGEGIFFTSRMFDSFLIVSGKINFGHTMDLVDILLEDEENKKGTDIIMRISPFSDKTTESIFNQFTDTDQNFDKTVVPVFLARYGDENLVSRSQAKRLLARFEKFKTVVLDFDRLDSIGRAFADEIFRVFKNAHPEIVLDTSNASESITKLIQEIQASQS